MLRVGDSALVYGHEDERAGSEPEGVDQGSPWQEGSVPLQEPPSWHVRLWEPRRVSPLLQ